ncbi:MAG TPA: hypothetical protein VMV21_18805, partial [Vicinamibacteria bacterium]|nr:hypothetical protein [Vicinamibacteria bacterium]
PADADGSAASRTLRRLVCFVAGALDVPFAFVAAFEANESSTLVRHASVWLAKDFGLRSEFARIELPETISAPVVNPNWAAALRRILPDEPDLPEQGTMRGVTVALRDSRDQVFGHLGLLASGPASGLFLRERLQPLGRLAAAELLRWVEGRD